MGHQIIRQPDGLYAVFSTFSDTWIVYDATREDLLDYYAGRAAKDARASASRTLDFVDEDPRKAYYQFTMTFEEANAKSVKHGGLDLVKEGHAARQEGSTQDA